MLKPSNTPQALLASEISPASGQQVEDQDDHRQYQEQVNEAAGNMEAEAQEPENHKNYEQCPKHILLLLHRGRPGIQSPSQAPAGIHNRLPTANS
jgi:hypothetical protein